MFAHRETTDPTSPGFYPFHKLGDVEELSLRNLVNTLRVEYVNSGVHLESQIRLLPKVSHQSILACLNNTVWNLEALDHCNDGHVIVIVAMIIVNVTVILLIDAIAVADEERRGNLVLQLV